MWTMRVLCVELLLWVTLLSRLTGVMGDHLSWLTGERMVDFFWRDDRNGVTPCEHETNTLNRRLPMAARKVRTIQVPYCTTDMYQASYLICVGHRMASMRADGGQVTFEFSANARTDAEDYPMSTVATLQFVSVVKSLKSAIATKLHPQTGPGSFSTSGAA